eukprot:m.38875 g.38875  ORF g.38875 m.38875 type:complete len:1083 (-) comp10247_c0_seq1:47-3295(-)
MMGFCYVVLKVFFLLLVSPLSYAKAEQSSQLKEWLHNTQLSLPSFNSSFGGDWNVEFNHLYCTNFTASDAVSIPSQHPASMDVQFTNLGMKCTSKAQGSDANTHEEYNGVMMAIFEKGKLHFTADRSSCNSHDQPHKTSSALSTPLPCLKAHDVTDSFKLSSFELVDSPPSLQQAVVKKLPVIKAELDAVLDVGFVAAIDLSVDVLATSLLQDVDKFINNINTTTAPLPPIPPTDDTLALDDFSLVEIMDLISNTVLTESIWFNMSDVVEIITKGTGVYELDGLNKTFDFPVVINNTINMTLALNKIELHHLNTLNIVDLFQPLSATRARTQIDMKNITVVVGFDYGGNIEHNDLINNKYKLGDNGSLAINLVNVTALLDMDLLISKKAQDAINDEAFYSNGCFASTINFTQLANIEVDFDIQNIQLSLASDTPNLNDLVDDTMFLLFDAYMHDVGAIFNSVLNSNVRDDLNSALQNWTANGSKECVNAIPQSWFVTYLTAGVLGGAYVLCVIAIRLQMYDKSHATAISSSKEKVPLLDGINFGDGDGGASMFRPAGKCFATEPSVSTSMRYILPLLLLGTMFVLAIADSRVSGSAYFNFVTPNGTNVHLPTIKTLMFSRTVVELFEAKVYPLAICIVVFSGVWPYVKLLFMLYAWVAPTKYMPVKKREFFLQVLDFLGKWSILDIYVSIMLIVGMHFHVPMLNNSDIVAVDLWVHPDDGLYYYWSTIIGSLILTHIMLHLHRGVLRENGNVVTPDLEAEMLCNHHFFSKHRFFELTMLGKLVVAFAILLTATAAVIGAYSYSFSFHFQGLAAWLVDTTEHWDSKNYSVFSMISNLHSSFFQPNGAPSWAIQILFTLFVIGIPLFQQFCLFILWFIPMKPRKHEVMLHFTEIVNAWAALEVFVLAIIVTVVQLEPLSQFIIGDNCNGINILLKLFLDTELNGVDKCFAVETELLEGCWILISCCCLSFISTICSLSLCTQAVRQRTGFVTVNVRKEISFTIGSSRHNSVSVFPSKVSTRSTTQRSSRYFSSIMDAFPYFDPNHSSSSSNGSSNSDDAKVKTCGVDLWKFCARLGLAKRTTDF